MKRRTASAGGTLLYAALFLACLYLLLRRLPYGAALDDEAFYLTVPWQMSQGSSLVLHQWNTAQLFGFLLHCIYDVFNDLGKNAHKNTSFGVIIA